MQAASIITLARALAVKPPFDMGKKRKTRKYDIEGASFLFLFRTVFSVFHYFDIFVLSRVKSTKSRMAVVNAGNDQGHRCGRLDQEDG